MPKEHPYRSLKLPVNAPFELRPSPGKGWGAFATRRIERGALICTEKTTATIRKTPPQIRDRDVQAAFKELSPDMKRQFLLLRDGGSGQSPIMLRTFLDNHFFINLGQNADGTMKPATCLICIQSRFNHSCTPNIRTEAHETKVDSYAIKDIMPGEEITFSYGRHLTFLSKHERQRYLPFPCFCEACQLKNPKEQLLSDMRRTIIRGLHYLSFGHDYSTEIDGIAKQGMLIRDPVLRKAAEKFQLSTSRSYVQVLLLATLLDEEGLLELADDEYDFNNLASLVCYTFREEFNLRIAMRAMEQKTWLQKLCVAWRLYGRSDPGDGTSRISFT